MSERESSAVCGRLLLWGLASGLLVPALDARRRQLGSSFYLYLRGKETTTRSRMMACTQRTGTAAQRQGLPQTLYAHTLK